jgi:hypothetical protein
MANNRSSKWKVSKKIAELAPWSKSPNKLTSKQIALLNSERKALGLKQDPQSYLEHTKEHRGALGAHLKLSNTDMRTRTGSINAVSQESHSSAKRDRRFIHSCLQAAVACGPVGPYRRSFFTRLRNSRRALLFFGSKPEYFKKSPNKWKIASSLELRLLSILIRAFGQSKNIANQNIKHNRVTINGRRVSKANMQVQRGDLVMYHSKTSNEPFHYSYSLLRKIPIGSPVHLEVNMFTRQAILLYHPRSLAFSYNIDLDV